MILTAISDRLGLTSVHNNSAYTVLRNYGNMVSRERERERVRERERCKRTERLLRHC